jgi:hypothetical protein
LNTCGSSRYRRQPDDPEAQPVVNDDIDVELAAVATMAAAPPWAARALRGSCLAVDVVVGAEFLRQFGLALPRAITTVR